MDENQFHYLKIEMRACAIPTAMLQHSIEEVHQKRPIDESHISCFFEHSHGANFDLILLLTSPWVNIEQDFLLSQNGVDVIIPL